MLAVKENEHELELELSRDELLVIHQSLNEVINGFRVKDFAEKIGNEEAVKAEIQKLGKLFDDTKDQKMPIMLTVTAEQIAIYRNGVRETCKEIDEWEFSTRIGGIHKPVAEELLSSLEKL